MFQFRDKVYMLPHPSPLFFFFSVLSRDAVDCDTYRCASSRKEEEEEEAAVFCVGCVRGHNSFPGANLRPGDHTQRELCFSGRVGAIVACCSIMLLLLLLYYYYYYLLYYSFPPATSPSQGVSTPLCVIYLICKEFRRSLRVPVHPPSLHFSLLSVLFFPSPVRFLVLLQLLSICGIRFSFFLFCLLFSLTGRWAQGWVCSS